MTTAAAPLTLNGGVDNYEQMLLDLVKLDNLPSPEVKYNELRDINNYDELMQQQDLILLKNLYPDIMSQVDVSQLPMTINNYNPLDVVNDFKDEAIKNAIKNFNYNLHKFNYDKNKNRPEARLLMDLSIDKFKTVKDNSQFIVLQPENNAKIMQQYNLNSPGLAIDPKWHGVAFANDSDMSRKLSTSPQLQKQVRSNFNSNRNVFKTDKIGIELNQDKNLHFSIGHGTILNPYIDNQGYFNGVLYDIYDFDLMKDYSNPYLARINNFAYGLQKVKFLDKYYVLVPIKFKL